MNLNSSPFPIDQINHDHIHHQQYPFAHNHQLVSSSSSSSASYHFLFNSTQDHSGFFHHQVYHQKDESYGYDGGSPYEIKNKVNSSAFELTLWKKEDEGPTETKIMKKMSLTAQKMKKTIGKVEDQKLQQPSSSLETDLSSNSSSYNSNSPIRVCADCHTTKTPLWRSGPKGPKSLCNACGIRQRKARRAMAAAAAAATANGTAVVSNQQPAMLKIRLKHKEKMGKNGHSSQLKKRCKMASGGGSSSGSGQKLGFEDFLINLRNNLSFHRVFPQDEKDAAILLMALSSGLVHG